MGPVSLRYYGRAPPSAQHRATEARRPDSTADSAEFRASRAVLGDAPIQQGLAELIGYLSLAEPGIAVVFDGEHREQVSWSPEDEEVERVADVPRVSFTRDRTVSG